MKGILFSNSAIQGLLPNLGILGVRLSSGLFMAFAHGINKVPPSDGFIGAVGNMGFPLPALFAWSAGLSEFLGGILIALGLMTRVNAFFLAFTMFVAAFIRHGGDPFKQMEMSLLYLCIYIGILLIGPGKFSLDNIINKK